MYSSVPVPGTCPISYSAVQLENLADFLAHGHSPNQPSHMPKIPQAVFLHMRGLALLIAYMNILPHLALSYNFFPIRKWNKVFYKTKYCKEHGFQLK